MPNIPIEACNEDGEQVRSFEVDGKEYPDSRPLEIPLGMSKPDTLTDIMRRLIHRELSQVADAAGAETFDEAGDFEIDDDPLDPLTPWEAFFEPLPPQESKPAAQEAGREAPAQPITPAPAVNQIASAGSGVSSSTATKVETPTPGGISGNTSS